MTDWGRRLILAMALPLALAGCMQTAPPPVEDEPPADEMPPPDRAPVPEVRVEELSSRFDPATADRLAATARAAEQRGDWSAARAAYRDAALANPTDPLLWDGLARTADVLGEEDLADDAQFMAARATLGETGGAYGHRVGESALRAYLATETVSPQRRVFVAALADRYSLTRAGDGRYVAPPTIDIDNREIPAAIASTALALGYPAAVLAGQ